MYCICDLLVKVPGGGGGTHMLRHKGMCHPNGLLLHQKSLDMGPILVKKSLEEGPISQKIQEKIVKSAILVAEKPSEMGLYLRKLKKKKKLSNQPFFE